MSEPAHQARACGVEPRELLEEGCQQLGLSLLASQLDDLMKYAHVLIKWRRVYNLVGARSLSEVITHHLLDSLSVVSAVAGRRLLDMGSGAGLPGLPIAMALPDLQVTLLDANAKRTRFLEHAVQTLRLRNVEVVRERAENYNPPQRFDRIVSRALCGWAEFAALAEPLLGETGQVLAMKGRFEEHSGEAKHAVKIVAVSTLSVPGIAGQRCLVRGVRQA
jgi:16S rRNA (guanine527-N7)-methyltransferase